MTTPKTTTPVRSSELVRRGQYQAAVREIMFLMVIESVSRRNFNRAVAVVRKVHRAPNSVLIQNSEAKDKPADR